MRIKAGTFNIQHGKDYPYFLDTGRERIDLGLMAETVRKMDVDFCGLNEVRNQTGAGLCNQAEAIAAKLGWHWAFVPAIAIKHGFYGNGIVSRFPIREVRAVPIQTTAKERDGAPHYEDRVLLIATLEAEGREITVFSCHFGLNDIEQEKAVQTVLREAEGITSPLLFMGDLNLQPKEEKIARLAEKLTDTAAMGAGDLLTFPSADPDRKIDYIFVKNATPLTSEVVPIVAADHYPLRAEIEI